MQVMKEQRERGEILSGIVGGTFSLTLSAIIVKILGLVYKIPLASLLGDEGMGYFNSAYTVYAFFYLLCTAGVPKAVMILLSEAKARGRTADERGIVRVAITMFLSLGAALTVIFAVFSAPLASLIGNSKSAATMVAIAPSIIFISLSGVIRGFLSANMRLLDIAVSQIIEGIGKLVLGLVFAIAATRLSLPPEIVSALTILGVTFGAFFGFLYLLICSKFKIKVEKTGQSGKYVKFTEVAKRILSISVPITVSAAIMSVTNIIDLGMIMRSLVEIGYSEAEANALYGNYTTLAVPMFNFAVSVITPISTAYLPLLTRCAAKSDASTFDKARHSALEITSLLSAPMMIGMMVFSEEILDLLFKNSETGIGAALLCLIAPAILFSSLLLVLNTVLEAYGRVRAPLASMIIGSLAKIAASYALITKAELGILGAPLGTVVCYGVALLVTLLIYTKTVRRHIPLFSVCLVPHINAFVAVALSRICFERLIYSLNESFSLIFAIVLAAFIYVGLSLFTGCLSVTRLNELSKYTKLAS